MISNEKHLNCAFLQGILSYVDERHGRPKLIELLDSVDIEYDFVINKRNWISWADYGAFLDAVEELDHSPNLWSIITKHSLTHDKLGAFFFIVAHNAISPKLGLETGIKSSKSFNHAADWEILELTDKNLVLKINWKPGIIPTKNQCLHRREYISSYIGYLGGIDISYKETQCIKEKADSCIEEYAWTPPKKRPPYFKLGLAAIACFIILGITNPENALLYTSLILNMLGLGSLALLYRDTQKMQENSEGQRQELALTVEEVEKRYDELQEMHSELDKAYEELFDAKKLEPLGVLSGSIAHDYNNFLTCIIGNIDYAMLSLEEDADEEQLTELLTDIDRAANQAKELTNRLLVFSKAGTPITKIVSLDTLIRETVEFSLTGSKVEVKFNFSDKLKNAHIDRNQFGQIFSNLTINAVQAMPHGGKISVSAENVTIGKSYPARFAAITEGEYVLITFADNGTGIPDDNLRRVFDPYFTTKQTGSGLGLASCYSIIKKHNGYIFVESEVNIGTTFYIYVPATDKPAVQIKKSQDEKPIMGKGRILVMDDDPGIRKILNSMLSYLGYQVDSTINASEAVSLYQQAIDSEHPFDAVILDLVIPGSLGGGKEAIEQLKQIDPNVKAIVTSGYSNEPIMANHQEYGFHSAIRKPYHLVELSEVVCEAVMDKYGD